GILKSTLSSQSGSASRTASCPHKPAVEWCARRRSQGSTPMLVNEPVTLPHIEAATAAWEVYPMCLPNFGLIVVHLQLHCIVEIVSLIDKMHAIHQDC